MREREREGSVGKEDGCGGGGVRRIVRMYVRVNAGYQALGSSCLTEDGVEPPAGDRDWYDAGQ